MLSNCKILITGGAGFIGTRLARLLVHDNEIVVYDILHRDALTNTDLAKHPNLTLIKGDVLDLPKLREAMAGASHVIHMASIAGVDTVISNPFRTMEVSIKGTFNALEAAGELDGLERFVDFSTSEVFGRYAYRVSEGDVTALGSVGGA